MAFSTRGVAAEGDVRSTDALALISTAIPSAADEEEAADGAAIDDGDTVDHSQTTVSPPSGRRNEHELAWCGVLRLVWLNIPMDVFTA